MDFVIRPKGYRQAHLTSPDEVVEYLTELGCKAIGPGDQAAWGTFNDGEGEKAFHIEGPIAALRGVQSLQRYFRMPVKKHKPQKAKKGPQRASSSVHDRLMRGEAVEAYRPAK